jgi:tagaturonate epimerase
MTRLTSFDFDVQPRSVVGAAGAEFALTRAGGAERLLIVAGAGTAWLSGFEGDRSGDANRDVIVGPLSPRNAAALRAIVPWLRPARLGLRTSAGFGDRLGVATPGHIRALRGVNGSIAPIFAQQSIREMARTNRTPQQVIDDAMWGVFAEGWREGFGADADHLKQPGDIDACLAAGFTFFTIDPGEHVQAAAGTASAAQIREAFAGLPWDRLEDTPASFARRFVGHAFAAEGHAIELDERCATVAAVKYGRAVAHAVLMYRHLLERAGRGSFELEVSLDETDTPTSHAEHVYVATELRRLGVSWVSLAPRFVGRFEKGVDYIGDAQAFERDIAVHAAIARALGPYKLSLHSGSDKFTVYPAAARETRRAVHLKTAGTSYLEALRTAAAADPDLFREIYAFSRECYEADRVSYHVSASLDAAPPAAALSAAALAALLDDFHAREILHVTFGSVLTATDAGGRPRFADRLMALLAGHRDAYAENLDRHFRRHLAPFAA